MSKRSVKFLALVLSVALLLSMPGLVACGDEQESERQEVVLGYLWDLTGRASFAVQGTYRAVCDYLDMSEKEGRLGEVEIKIVTYDTQSDPGRVVPGYLWLKGQGAQVMSCAPQDAQILRPRFEADHMPFLCGSASMSSLLDSTWHFSLYPPTESQLEVIMQWITQEWDYSQRKPRVAFIGLGGVPYYEGQLERAKAAYESNPGEYESFKWQMPPATTTSWATELGRLMDSDFIITALSGPPLVSFTKEARSRGYWNRLVGPFESYLAFWSLVKDAVASEDMDGVVTLSFGPWWDDDVPFIREVKELSQSLLSPAEYEATKTQPYRITGTAEGMVLVDVVGRAAEDGIINSSAIRDAAANTDMYLDGWGNEFVLSEGMNCFVQTMKLLEYKASEGKWVSISDWVRPPSLGG